MSLIWNINSGPLATEVAWISPALCIFISEFDADFRKNQDTHKTYSNLLSLQMFIWPFSEFYFQTLETTNEGRAGADLNERIQQLEVVVAQYREEANKGQAEVDRLLEILKEMENEKNDKDKKIAELEK